MRKSDRMVRLFQPYVPAYRVPLFERIDIRLAEQGLKLSVVCAGARGQADRLDQASAMRWMDARKGVYLPLRSGHELRMYGRVEDWTASAAVVVEFGSGSIDSSLFLAGPRKAPVGLWGHMWEYDSVGRLDHAVEQWQIKRADHIFAYTQVGSNYARRVRERDGQVTTLNNTVDLAGLEEARSALTAAGVSAFLGDLGLRRDGEYGAWIGSLASPKRVDLVAEALDYLADIRPDFRLLLGGAGSELEKLRRHIDRGQVIYLGRVGNREKALMGAVCRFLVNPGRVGLVAVESFVLGLPIVTVFGPLQAPEFGYLVDNQDSIILPAETTARQYALAIAELLGKPAQIASLRRAARARSGEFSLERMASNFASGIEQMISKISE